MIILLLIFLIFKSSIILLIFIFITYYYFSKKKNDRKNSKNISRTFSGVVGGHFFYAHLFSHAVGREGCSKQITLECARSVSATLGLPHSWCTPLRL